MLSTRPGSLTFGNQGREGQSPIGKVAAIESAKTSPSYRHCWLRPLHLGVRKGESKPKHESKEWVKRRMMEEVEVKEKGGALSRSAIVPWLDNHLPGSRD